MNLTQAVRRCMRFVLLLAFAGSLSACATSGNPRDPLEGFNRAMFSFNDAVDKAAIKPAATVYQKITPSPVQTGIGNFFGNLGDAWTAVNQFLQGKVKEGFSDVMRFAFNSTFGLGGVLDIASEAGIPKHKEDFGQTLGKWGVKSGPYLVLPVFGPSTFRDSLAFGLDMKADPWGYKKPVYLRNSGTALRLLDQRASLLDAGNLMEEAALDRYSFVRDAYLQRRQSIIYDGAEPEKPADKGAQAEADDSAPASVQVAAPPPADSAPEPAASAGTGATDSGIGQVASENVQALPETREMREVRGAWRGRMQPCLLQLDTH